jgi:hypothetical protein
MLLSEAILHSSAVPTMLSGARRRCANPTGEPECPHHSELPPHHHRRSTVSLTSFSSVVQVPEHPMLELALASLLPIARPRF